MKITNLQYHGEFEFTEKDDGILEISGIAFRSGKIENKKVFIEEKELNPIANSMKNIPVIDSHMKDSVKNVLGKVVKAWVDGIYIKYIAHIHDAQVINLIKQKLIRGVSVGLQFEKSEELEDGWLKLIGLICRELSLVNFPALPEAVINYGEFSLNIEATDEPEPEQLDLDSTLENLAVAAYEELKTKFDSLKNLYEEQLSQNVKLNKELQNLSKSYEYLKTYNIELPEKYLAFDLETCMLYGQLMAEGRNAMKTMGTVQDEETDSATEKDEAKEALRDLMFNRDDKKKSDISTFKDWQKKYGNMSDYK